MKKMSEMRVSKEQALVEAWIAECKSVSSRNLYRRNARAFLAMTEKPLSQTITDDITTYYEEHTRGTIASRSTALSAVKSLLSYAVRKGLMTQNPGANVQITHERYDTVRPVVDQREIERMILLETDERNSAILLTAYSGGLLISELAGLKWADVARHESGAATLRVIGYKDRIREVQISVAAWNAVSILRGHARPSDPIFVSKKGGHMDPTSIHRVVKAAVVRAGLPENMSTYWLRHAQTAHSLAAGMPLHLLQKKLGHTELDSTQRYVQMFVVSR